MREHEQANCCCAKHACSSCALPCCCCELRDTEQAQAQAGLRAAGWCRTARHACREPKVCEQHVTVAREQQVGGLDVAVQHAVRLQVVEREQQLAQPAAQRRLLQLAALLAGRAAQRRVCGQHAQHAQHAHGAFMRPRPGLQQPAAADACAQHAQRARAAHSSALTALAARARWLARSPPSAYS